MSSASLEDMLSELSFADLPPSWTSFNSTSFSSTKSLWDYQVRAVENVVKVLWKYFQEFGDYKNGELLVTQRDRKEKLWNWYVANGLTTSLDAPVPRDAHVASLLSAYYSRNEDHFPYSQFINRASLWMATGSGKTLVLLKLLEVLHFLMKGEEVPACNVLVLSYRDDLLNQLKTYVREFNVGQSHCTIRLRELREYPEAKRGQQELFSDRELTVFYYRSDNLSDEQKERIVDFRNFDDGGRWFVLLDEAHKGDKEDSKRQHIYSILSRNGFLFNFSATFTDPRDLATTALNFNLAEFIQAGYGKHISVLRQEFRAFRDNQDYSSDEKQKIVLKSLILLSYTQAFCSRVKAERSDLYHRPLLLTLVNSVNPDDADLELFFRELERIGRGKVTKTLWKAAKRELLEELVTGFPLLFEEQEPIPAVRQVLDSIELPTVLQSVFNAPSPGEMEVMVRPGNKQELCLKLRTADKPFALIKIGDISGWLRDKLRGYEVIEGFQEEGFFEGLNADNSDITTLMGSRSFYEGWDSNRPTVMTFINIGVGVDARKFILQAVGRGVRIEPVKDQRKRLLPLYNAGVIDSKLFTDISTDVPPLETLVILGTNRPALQAVMEHLEKSGGARGANRLELFLNDQAEGRELLIPVYKRADAARAAALPAGQFELAAEERTLLRRYLQHVNDDRVLMALYDADPTQLARIRKGAAEGSSFFGDSQRMYRNMDLILGRALEYLSITPERFDRIKVLEDEINHYKHVTVTLQDWRELQTKVAAFKDYKDPDLQKVELRRQLDQGQITLDRYTEGVERAARTVRESRVYYENRDLLVRHVANHYYIPVILSEGQDRVGYIKHIIQTPSEVQFLNRLEAYAAREGSKLKQFDWWMFSKLDESLDRVYIPYYDGASNRLRQFNPDFIFWLARGEQYTILFIDPKGTEHTAYQRKLDGYTELFEENGQVRAFTHGRNSVKVFARLFTENPQALPRGYRRFWFKDIDEALSSILI